MESKKRNEELYYTARDLAVIFNNLALDCQSEAEILGNIWAKERAYLREPYRSDRRRLYLDTLYWESYYYHKDSLDKELKTISKDCRDVGGSLKEEDYMSDFADVDLFFVSGSYMGRVEHMSGSSAGRCSASSTHSGCARRWHSASRPACASTGSVCSPVEKSPAGWKRPSRTT